MSNEEQSAISKGVSLGRITGRATTVVFALYVASIVYRSGQENISIALGTIVVLYAFISSLRDVRYGYSPWAPVEWIPTSPDELDLMERQRAIRWMITLRLLQIIGVAGTAVAVYTASLETLGYVFLIGGIPALVVQIYRHYDRGTRPWYPSVPQELEIER
jgi:hypothetical protein